MISSPILSDFDGTYSDHPEIHGLVDAIVTGRSWEDYQDFKDEKEGPDIPVFMNPISQKENDQMKIVTHKANIINALKAVKYYEDVAEEANMLKILCPSCKIILVEKGKTYI